MHLLKLWKSLNETMHVICLKYAFWIFVVNMLFFWAQVTRFSPPKLVWLFQISKTVLLNSHLSVSCSLNKTKKIHILRCFSSKLCKYQTYTLNSWEQWKYRDVSCKWNSEREDCMDFPKYTFIWGDLFVLPHIVCISIPH